MSSHPLPLLVAAALVATTPACSDDTAAPPDPTPAIGSTTEPPAGTVASSAPASPVTSVASLEPPPTVATAAAELPDACTAPHAPMYPLPATERWVPSPESGDVLDDFARLVLGWPDVQVGDARADGAVTRVRVTSGAVRDPVELTVLPDGEGRPASVCGARSVIGGGWSTSVSIRDGAVVAGFTIRTEGDGEGTARVIERLPDVVSAQLLTAHGPHVQQVAANDPERGWSFELDHDTSEPGWQLAFWRDADGAALAVVDTRLPAGDVSPD